MNLELTLPDKRGVENQICWNKARFFEYTGTNAFSRIQKVLSPRTASAQKPRLFPTYQDLADSWRLKLNQASRKIDDDDVHRESVSGLGGFRLGFVHHSPRSAGSGLYQSA